MVAGFSGEMKIKFLKNPAKYNLAYFAGDVCEMEDKQAAELIANKYAEEVEEKETKKKAK